MMVEQRAAVIERFREGKEKVLVTTNVCARGEQRLAPFTRLGGPGPVSKKSSCLLEVGGFEGHSVLGEADLIPFGWKGSQQSCLGGKVSRCSLTCRLVSCGLSYRPSSVVCALVATCQM